MISKKRTSQLRIRAFTVAVAIAALAGAGALRADTIKLASGEIKEGVKVNEATSETVSFSTGGGSPQRLDAGLIVELTRASGYLNKIRSALQKGEYSTAKMRADDAVSFGDDWEKAEAAFLIGEIYLAAGSEKAVEAYADYLKDYKSKKDFFVPHAIYGLGQAYLLAKKPAEAKKHFAELSSMGGRDGIWSSKAKIGEARAIIGSNSKSELLDARKLLLDVVRTRGAAPEIQEEALVLRGRVFVLQGNHKGATDLLEKDYFRGRKAGNYSRFFAQACSVMGDAFVGLDGKSNLQEAEIWFLKGALFGKNYPGEYREAVNGLVAVYRGLGQTARATEWQSRIKS